MEFTEISHDLQRNLHVEFAGNKDRQNRPSSVGTSQLRRGAMPVILLSMGAEAASRSQARDEK